MNILVIVAHPDDEVLGCGATGAAIAAAGGNVRACILSGHAEARGGRPSGDDLLSDTHRAQQLLGFGPPILGNFPNIKLNTVPHIELVQFIEHALLETRADVLFTHHPSDINDDHVQTSRACQAAARLSQRRTDVAPLRRLLFMEVFSSTDWAFAGAGVAFQPTAFVGVADHLERKCEALRAYRGVMRDFPHPRSEEVVRGLAAYRGGQAGLRYAEAFQVAFETVAPRELV